MDKLMSSFVNTYIKELEIEDLVQLEKLLDIDDNNLYNYFIGVKTDIEFENNKINSLFKNFKLMK